MCVTETANGKVYVRTAVSAETALQRETVSPAGERELGLVVVRRLVLSAERRLF